MALREYRECSTVAYKMCKYVVRATFYGGDRDRRMFSGVGGSLRRFVSGSAATSRRDVFCRRFADGC